MADDDHPQDRINYRNGFDRYKQSLSGLRTWKGVVLSDDRRNNLHDYRDLGDEHSDE